MCVNSQSSNDHHHHHHFGKRENFQTISPGTDLNRKKMNDDVYDFFEIDSQKNLEHPTTHTQKSISENRNRFNRFSSLFWLKKFLSSFLAS